jgi:ATP-binding protein involved in chromosome partitioning
MSVTRETVLAALGSVPMPGRGQSIVEADIVRALAVEGGSVRFVLEVDPAEGARLEPVRAAAEAAVAALPGVERVSALLTAHGPVPKGSPVVPGGAPPSLKIGRHPEPQAGPAAVPGVKRIIAVASGKGGVGKSTVSANLAVALARAGKRTGLLDADIYGPSQPRMMGVNQRPQSPDGKTILPLHAHGVTLMSIGLML